MVQQKVRNDYEGTRKRPSLLKKMKEIQKEPEQETAEQTADAEQHESDKKTKETPRQPDK